jgi:hypothetical protein
MNLKRMRATITSFVNDLHGMHLLLGIDAHLNHLAVFGEYLICKFHAAWTAGGSTFFCDHSTLFSKLRTFQLLIRCDAKIPIGTASLCCSLDKLLFSFDVKRILLHVSWRIDPGIAQTARLKSFHSDIVK